MRIPFVGGSGPARSPDADSQRTVNAYVEMDKGNPRAPMALYGMPGLVLAHQMGGGPIRGSIQCGVWSFFVSGSQVFKRNTDGAVTQLTGSMTSSSGPVSLASNGHAILIADGGNNLYYANTTGDVLLKEPSDFPDVSARLQGVAWLAGYWLTWGNHPFDTTDDQRFYWRPDTDGITDWNGLDFASVQSHPDALVAGIADHGQMWFVGAESTEIFNVVADPDLPFQRSGAGFIDLGTPAPHSVRSFDNSVVWLARNDDGQGMFIRTQGGNPVRFSDHKVEAALAQYATLSDAIAFTFTLQGHAFYACTFPTADATWVYDAASGLWAEWLWRNPADGTLHAHRAINHVFTSNEPSFATGGIPVTPTGSKHLVGDRINGNVYELRMDAYTDNGDPILLIRRAPNVYDEGSTLTMQELRIDMETGVGNSAAPDPVLQLRAYRDGRTPGAWKTKRIGSAGQHAKQIRFHGLGQGVVWGFELQILDPVKRAIFGGYARVAKSRSGA